MTATLLRMWYARARTGLTEAQCFQQKCNGNQHCFQAIFRVSPHGTTECRIGLNKVTEAPNPMSQVGSKCYSKAFPVTQYGIPSTDYMKMLEDEAAGKRQAYMVENKMYYLSPGVPPDRGNDKHEPNNNERPTNRRKQTNKQTNNKQTHTMPSQTTNIPPRSITVSSLPSPYHHYHHRIITAIRTLG